MKALIRMTIVIGLAVVMSSFSEQGRWIIDPKSTLSIYGSTNVNSFRCMYDSYNLNDTLEYVQDSRSIEMKITRNRMRIPIRSFDCGNKQITRDFWQTLKSERYPELEISFRSFRNSVMRDNTYVDGVVDITLAGATKRYVVRYHATVPDSETLFLVGMQAVNFSDFKLEPPQKMMGLIQVQECLEVEFKLKLKTL